jgi:hypothetical protein
METIIGIDVRQRQHYVVAITERGELSFVFTHRRVGFESFSKWISEVAPLPRAFAVNKNEPFTTAVAAWLRGNGETVHVSDQQAAAQQLAQSLRSGVAVEQRPQKQSVKELLDLAVFYLRISIAAMS